MADDSVYSSADDDSTERTAAKYFVHGAAFSLLTMVLAVVWAIVALTMIALSVIGGIPAGGFDSPWLNSETSPRIASLGHGSRLCE